MFGDPSQQGRIYYINYSNFNVFSFTLGLYGTKEELNETEDFFPFIYVPINI